MPLKSMIPNLLESIGIYYSITIRTYQDVGSPPPSTQDVPLPREPVEAWIMEEHPSLGPLLRQGTGQKPWKPWVSGCLWRGSSITAIKSLFWYILMWLHHGRDLRNGSTWYNLWTVSVAYRFRWILMIQTAASGTGKDGPRVSSVRWGSSTDEMALAKKRQRVVQPRDLTCNFRFFILRLVIFIIELSLYNVCLYIYAQGPLWGLHFQTHLYI